jgi:protein CpxP
MKNIYKASAALAASAAVLAFGYAALGQDQPAAPRQPPTAEQRAQWRAQRQAEHAQRLSALLNLRPDQQPALQALLAALAPQRHEHDGQRPDGADAAQLTTPQRLDRMADRMAKHEAEFHQRADAIRTFYAALSPEQQKAFDAMPMLMMGGDHQRGGHGEHHGGHDGQDHGPQGDAG